MSKFLACFRPFINIRSLRVRLIIMLIACVMVPIALLGLISYDSILSLLNDNIHSGVKNILSQERYTLESTLDNLNYVSQQLAYEDIIYQNLYEYFDTSGSYSKTETIRKLSSEVSLIELTNKNISNITYYYQDQYGTYQKIFSTATGSDLPDQYMKLSSKNNVMFYGPHKTDSIISNFLVISTIKKFRLPYIPEVSIYLESGYQQVENVLSQKQYNIKAYHALYSDDGLISYSQNSDILPLSKSVKDIAGIYTDGNQNQYYTFTEPSKYGWGILLLMPKSDYDQAITAWVLRTIVTIILSLFVSTFIAYCIWNIINTPIIRLNNELKDIDNLMVVDSLKTTNVNEFDEYLQQFHKMKSQIIQLLNTVEEETRKKSLLEVQQLFYMINPHFLHNTLDTIKWYADMKGWEDMVKLISSLNKLLVYNLRVGEESTLKQEIDAIDDYIVLQSIKYDLSFEKHVDLTDRLMKARMPKFILQPLVENAIYHGVEGNGKIRLEAEASGGSIFIRIIDNGVGISEGKAKEIVCTGAGPDAGGIGVRYVVTKLRHMFGDRGGLCIRDNNSQGTVVEIQIPSGEEGFVHDEGSCS